ncbi:MAG: hypothetical protein JOZ53_27445, partial [Planctomycetaceae bacterium]|nr:hypothetical protein [Planctomycetaceae bacterium]
LTDVVCIPRVFQMVEYRAIVEFLGMEHVLEQAWQDRIATQDEIQAWLKGLEETNRGGQFFATVMGLIVGGSKIS